MPQFQDLPVGTIESLAHVMTEKEYPPKSVIYYQGNEVEDFFIVQRGCVKVRVPLHADAGPGYCHLYPLMCWLAKSYCTH